VSSTTRAPSSLTGRASSTWTVRISKQYISTIFDRIALAHSPYRREAPSFFFLLEPLYLGVSTFRRFDVTFHSDETWNATIFCYVGTAKRGTQTKFLTFQCNFCENLTFRSNETWNTNFFFTLDKRNVKRNNSVSLSFRTFDRSNYTVPYMRCLENVDCTSQITSTILSCHPTSTRTRFNIWNLLLLNQKY
jgi:hypothetical protein